MTTFTIPYLCGSISGKASGLGVRIHNAAYEATALNHTYVAIQTDTLDASLQACRTLAFRGLGIAMPFKQDVISLLDDKSPHVTAIGACNTVIFTDGHLVGHNTDWQGALDALDEVYKGPLTRAVIVGAGGVARAIAYALKQRSVAIHIAARSSDQRRELVRVLQLNSEGPLETQGSFDAELVVNATPNATSDSPLRLEAHRKAAVLLDVVFTQRDTELAQKARGKGLCVAPGWRMLLHQAAHQFQLYTGTPAPLVVMERVLREALQ